MKKLLLGAFILLDFFANSQSNYQRKLFQAAGTGTVTDVVYSNEYNTSTFVIENLAGPLAYTGFSSLTKFTTTTGNVTSSKSFSVSGYDLSIKSVTKNNQMLYMVAGLTNSAGVTGCIIKYNLSTNATVWRKTLSTGTVTSVLSAITYDKDKNLYVSGVSYGNSILVSKLDTNGNLGWIKTIPQNSYTPTPGNILYNGKRELYVTSTGTFNAASIGSVLRLDSAGTFLNSNDIYTTVANGFREKYSAILKGKLVTIDKTIYLGSGDSGPFLIRSLDTNLTATITKTLDGLNIKQIYSNNINLLISGPSAFSSNNYCFGAVRFDTLLNVFGARYFQKINIQVNSLYTNSTASFINSTNNSFHFFKSNTNSHDTLSVIRADIYEGVGCNDTAYVPASPALSFSVLTYPYNTTAISGTLTTITIPIGTITYSSTSLCTALTTGIPSISNNEFVSVFPNPAASTLSIRVENELASKFRITDIAGKEVIAAPIKESIDISYLQKGIYFIALFDKGEQLIYIKKFVKE